MENCTLSGNTASDTGGAIDSYGPSLELTNTIIANTLQGRTCTATVSTGGHNLDDDGTCGLFNMGDLSIVPANLAPLGDYGGPTQTIAPLPGSPAINAGDQSVCAAPPVNNLDQRG